MTCRHISQCFSTKIATCITRFLIKKQNSIMFLLLHPQNSPPCAPSSHRHPQGKDKLDYFDHLQILYLKIIQCKLFIRVVSFPLHAFLVEVCSCYQSSWSSLISPARWYSIVGIYHNVFTHSTIDGLQVVSIQETISYFKQGCKEILASVFVSHINALQVGVYL